MKVADKNIKYLENEFHDMYNSLIFKLEWVTDYKRYAENYLEILNNLIECRKEIDPLTKICNK